MKRIWFVVAALSAVLLLGGNQTPHADQGTIDLSQWTPPDIGAVGDDPFGKLVKYGHKLFTDTANEVGPSVLDPGEALSGQQSCVPELPSASWHPALCHAFNRCVGAIPAISSAGGHG